MLNNHPLLGETHDKKKLLNKVYNHLSRSLLMQKTETKAKYCRITNLFYPDRSGMNEMNKFPSMGMRRKEKPCEDTMSTKKCLKLKKWGKCKKVGKVCKKTCDICNDGEGRLNPICCFYEISSTSFCLSQMN